MTFRRAAALPVAVIALAALAGCARVVPPASPPPVATAPAPRPAPAAPPVQAPQAGNWADAPATPGTWRHSMAGRASVADFVGTDGQRLFQLVCGSGGVVTLNRFGAAARGAEALTFRTRTAERTVSAQAADNAVTTALPSADPLLAAMAYSRGRFAVEVPGMATLYLPAWPEVTRVVDDCQ